MKGSITSFILAVGLTAAAVAQANPAQVPAVVTAAAPSPASQAAESGQKTCCCVTCQRDSGEKPSLITDPAIIVALIGLFGAWLKYVYDHWVRKRTINVTILTEVARLLEVAHAHWIWWKEKVKDKDTDQVLIAFITPVFDSQMQSLGDLDRRYAGDIVRFYGFMKFLNSLQATKPLARDKRKSEEFNVAYRDALEKLVDTYKQAFKPAFEAYKINTRL